MGVDLRHGGTIDYLAARGEENLVNDYDFGRQVQPSYYSGPVPFDHPKPPWQGWSWNPVGTGDRYGHPSKVLTATNDGTTIYVKSRPLQWALDDIPCECVFEQWITLQGSAVWVRNRLTNERSDYTQYPAFDQELPAVYATGRFRRLVAYTGSDPFHDKPVSDFDLSSERITVQATEHWVALVDSRGSALGVIQPDVTRFLTRLAGASQKAGPKDFSTAYVAPVTQEILDHDIAYTYEYGLVVGSVPEVRSYAATVRPPPAPAYEFSADREHWRYENASDTGWPIRGALRVSLEQSDPRLVGPLGLWSAADVPKVYVRAAYRNTPDATAELFWRLEGAESWSGSATVPVLSDGSFHTYKFDLAGRGGYHGAVTQLRFDPSDGDDPGGQVDVASITGTPPEGR